MVKYWSETCVLMGSFGKYQIFGIQLHKIWELDFNMRSNIVLMHYEVAPFFVPKFPNIWIMGERKNLKFFVFWLENDKKKKSTNSEFF